MSRCRFGLRMRCRSRSGVCAAAALLGALGCSTGEGEGFVTSDQLFVEDCWNGPFDLQPDFFGANPFEGESLTVRIQRGDNLEEVSDGLVVLIRDLPGIRGEGDGPSLIGQDVSVGLPVGVSPPGVPVQFEPDPPKVNIALYLHNSCHQQNGTVYSLDGTINFTSLFSGDVNESNSADRLTEATFVARFADPRELVNPSEDGGERISTVSGYFRFFFQRGQPAQPFP